MSCAPHASHASEPRASPPCRYNVQFARLVSLVMTRQAMDSAAFSRNVPAGEPQRLRRETDLLVRWFTSTQPSGRHKVAHWLTPGSMLY